MLRMLEFLMPPSALSSETPRTSPHFRTALVCHRPSLHFRCSVGAPISAANLKNRGSNVGQFLRKSLSTPPVRLASIFPRSRNDIPASAPSRLCDSLRSPRPRVFLGATSLVAASPRWASASKAKCKTKLSHCPRMTQIISRTELFQKNRCHLCHLWSIPSASSRTTLLRHRLSLHLRGSAGAPISAANLKKTTVKC